MTGLQKKPRNGVPTIVSVRPAPGNRSRALVILGGNVFPAAIGRSGRTCRKREGDGATPVATMRVLRGYIRGDRLVAPPTALQLIRTRATMLWCDAPLHAAYNRPVSAPFAAGHEKMMRDDAVYDVCIVLDWNITSRRHYGGSAIFLHLARPGYDPTEGCIAVDLKAMKRLLRVLRPGSLVRITV